MNENQGITKELLKEKSLLELYKLSWRLPIPTKELFFCCGVFASLLIYSVITISESAALINQARAIIDLGISLTSTILALLIAGFTIFASLTNPNLFVTMAKIQDKKSGLSWLKKSFLVFMHVFAHYISFLIVAVLLKILAYPKGLIPVIVKNLPCFLEINKAWLAAFAFSIMSGWLVYLLVLLGHFIFNIYHACMLSISVANENLLENTKTD